MGKKSQAKKILLSLYEDSIEEYSGAAEIVDLVWGEGTTTRWTDKYNEKDWDIHDIVFADPVPYSPDLRSPTPTTGWVEEEGVYGVYWRWDEESPTMVGPILAPGDEIQVNLWDGDPNKGGRVVGQATAPSAEVQVKYFDRGPDWKTI